MCSQPTAVIKSTSSKHQIVTKQQKPESSINRTTQEQKQYEQHTGELMADLESSSD